MSSANVGQTVAILGGGAVGAALFRALVDALAAHASANGVASANARPRVVLYEKSARVGRGLAYAADPSPYLLNQSARTMSLVPEARAHFWEWLTARGARDGGDDDDDDGEGCARRVFGDYVEDVFARALDDARRRGIAASVVRDEVTALEPRSAVGYRVVSTTHAPLDADVVVLAIGNLPSRRFRDVREAAGDRFFPSPYPSAELARIPKEARVGILGTGLTAIDAALALFAAGHRAPVTMASRSGLLPAVRGPLTAHTLEHVTHDAIADATSDGRRPLRWATVLGWLEREATRYGVTVDWNRDFPAWADPLAHLESHVAAAERGPRGWQALGEALNPMIEVIWNHLDPDDKELFLNRHFSRFMSHWVPVPLATGRRVLELLRDGKLVVARGAGALTYDGDAGAHRLAADGAHLELDYVIDATGAPRHLADCESPLVDALVDQGTIAPSPFGGARVDFETLQVIGRSGRADPALYALGHLTCGTHLFTSTLERNVHKAARVAQRIAADVHRRCERERRVDATPHPT